MADGGRGCRIASRNAQRQGEVEIVAERRPVEAGQHIVEGQRAGGDRGVGTMGDGDLPGRVLWLRHRGDELALPQARDARADLVEDRREGQSSLIGHLQEFRSDRGSHARGILQVGQEGDHLGSADATGIEGPVDRRHGDGGCGLGKDRREAALIVVGIG